ncbi:SDR family oxidoreductase [Rhodococcus sp. IEGM 248]|uniref:SDR family oxidoreductase n=1 Tax=Rhodococcus opacus TaxID=37919 RepID=UPI0013C0AD9D|nr:SDR family oxidoreductase [Rhodococcus opacus]MDV7088500.1 SDR family oxidoreductase [Rhodococcus opacus]NDV06717.1 SDR family oxidoreductase [Rhodococcus sp. IEGM 248]
MRDGKTLVVGAHGVIGSAVVRTLTDEGRDVVTVARRGPVELPGITTAADHIQVDLLDGAATSAAFAGRSDIDTIVYAAYAERESMAATVAPNVAMLRHVLEAVGGSPSTLRHVVLIGGGKSYGEHLGFYKTPAKETDPRHLGPIFYNDQEDLLFADAWQHGYTWTVLRPDAVLGVSIGSPMNMLTGVGVYATLCRHQGLPLRFPGTPKAWTALHQATDSGVVGAAVHWALEAETARGEVFNVTNGDNFRWQHLWSDIAGFFGMDVAPMQPMTLAEQMADKSALWDDVVARHQLRPLPLSAVAAWPFVDGWFAMESDMVQSTIKIRQAGFTACIDTHESFVANLEQLQRLRLIP